MRKLECLRCGSPMSFLMREKFQKGESGAWVGDVNFKFRGGFEMEVYSCPKCGRLEFFQPGKEDEEPAEPGFEELPIREDRPIVRVSEDGIPQIQCPACGWIHDFDYPKCPKCQHEYE